MYFRLFCLGILSVIFVMPQPCAANVAIVLTPAAEPAEVPGWQVHEWYYQTIANATRDATTGMSVLRGEKAAYFRSGMFVPNVTGVRLVVGSFDATEIGSLCTAGVSRVVALDDALLFTHHAALGGTLPQTPSWSCAVSILEDQTQLAGRRIAKLLAESTNRRGVFLAGRHYDARLRRGLNEELRKLACEGCEVFGWTGNTSHIVNMYLRTDRLVVAPADIIVTMELEQYLELLSSVPAASNTQIVYAGPLFVADTLTAATNASLFNASRTVPAVAIWIDVPAVLAKVLRAPTPTVERIVVSDDAVTVSICNGTGTQAGSGWFHACSSPPRPVLDVVLTAALPERPPSQSTIVVGRRYFGTYKSDRPHVLVGASMSFIVINSSPYIYQLDLRARAIDQLQLNNCTLRVLSSAFVVPGRDELIIVGGSYNNTVFYVRSDASSDVECRTASVTGDMPGRSAHTSTAVRFNNSAGAIIMGGDCGVDMPCTDAHFLLTDFSSPNPRFEFIRLATGLPAMVDAAATAWDRLMTIENLTDTQWVVVAGGEASASTGLGILFFGVNTKQFRRLEVPDYPSVRRPCIFVRGEHLGIFGGVTSEPSTVSGVVFFNADLGRWSPSRTYNAWPAGSGSCAVVPPSVAPVFTVLHALTDASLEEGLVEFEQVPVDCGPLRDQNYVLSPSSIDCIRCPEQTVARGRECAACGTLSPEARERTPWCARRDGPPIITGFLVVFVMQLVWVPVVWVWVFRNQQLQRMANNERAAVEMSEAVAEMMFERVAYLNAIRRPTRIEKALRRCVDTFKAYRSFLPVPILIMVDDAMLQQRFEESRPKTLSVSAISSNNSDDSLEPVAPSTGIRDAGLSTSTAAPAVSASAPSRYLFKSLSPTLAMRSISIAAINIGGFSAWLGRQFSDDVLVRRYRKMLDVIIREALIRTGTPDFVCGDKLLLSWNTAQETPDDHFLRCLEFSHVVANNPQLKQLKLKLYTGVASGFGRVGIVGGDSAKNHTVISNVAGEASALCRLAPQFNTDVLLEWSDRVQNVASDIFVFRIVGAGYFYRNPPGCGRSHVTEEPPHPTQSLICELLAPCNHRQWLYEQKGYREHIDTYNTVMRTVFVGKIDDARKIPLTNMPKWYESALKTVLNHGSPPTVDIYSL